MVFDSLQFDFPTVTPTGTGTADISYQYLSTRDGETGLYPVTPSASSAQVGITAVNVAGADINWTAANAPGRGSSATPLTSPDNTDLLKITNFQFNIPAGATITGVVATVTRSADVGGGVTDLNVKLVVAGSAAGNDKADAVTTWPTSAADAAYGGVQDLWGNTLTQAIVNASNFGLAISAAAGGTAVTPTVEQVTLTVYYTPAVLQPVPVGLYNIARYNWLIAQINQSAPAGGTTPTLATKLQSSMDGSNWYDLLSFTGITTSGAIEQLAGSRHMLVASAQPMKLGRYLRWKFSVGSSAGDPVYTCTGMILMGN